MEELFFFLAGVDTTSVSKAAIFEMNIWTFIMCIII
jgi:hypothetical protein